MARVLEVYGDGTRLTVVTVPDDIDAQPRLLENVAVSAQTVTVFGADATLRSIVERSWTSHLRVFVSPDVFANVFRDFLDKHVRPVLHSLVKRVVIDLVPCLLNAAVDSSPGPLLSRRRKFSRLDDVWKKLDKECQREAEAQLLRALDTLMTRENAPYSQNDYLYETLQKRRTDKLRRRVKDLTASGLTGAALRRQIDLVFDANAKQSVGEYTTEELNHVLQAYWRVVAKCLIDEVPQLINMIAGDGVIADWTQRCDRFAKEHGPDHIADLFEEPIGTRRRREMLEAEASKFENALFQVHDISVSI